MSGGGHYDGNGGGWLLVGVMMVMMIRCMTVDSGGVGGDDNGYGSGG